MTWTLQSESHIPVQHISDTNISRTLAYMNQTISVMSDLRNKKKIVMSPFKKLEIESQTSWSCIPLKQAYKRILWRKRATC